MFFDFIFVIFLGNIDVEIDLGVEGERFLFFCFVIEVDLISIFLNR